MFGLEWVLTQSGVHLWENDAFQGLENKFRVVWREVGDTMREMVFLTGYLENRGELCPTSPWTKVEVSSLRFL